MQNVKEKPKNNIVACFLEYKSQFLILHRNPGGRHGEKWGLPAGKVEKKETKKNAICREVYEEIGFKIPSEKLEFLQKIIFDFPEKIIDFFIYRVNLESKIDIILDLKENQSYAWITGKECYGRNDLIDGVRTTLEKTGYASSDDVRK